MIPARSASRARLQSLPESLVFAGMKPFVTLITLQLALSLAAGAAPREVILQAFEGDGFGDWEVEGKAFGLAPVAGGMDELAGPVVNYSNEWLAASAHGGPESTGTLTSPEFEVSHSHAAFLIGGGRQAGKTAVQLLKGDRVLREAVGRNDLKLRREIWDLSEHAGEKLRFRIIDAAEGEWGFVLADHFVLTNYPNPKFPAPEKDGQPAIAGLVATEVIPGMTIPQGSGLTIVADHEEHGVYSPTALCFDEQGELQVAETHRFRHGVEDNRSRLYWYLDDLGSRSVKDRVAMLDKWREKVPMDYMTEKSEHIRRLADQGEDGRYEEMTVFADGFDDQLDGTAAGVFVFEGTTYFANIPKIWALRDDDGDGVAEYREVVEDGFGVRYSFSGHDLNGFALHPDGRIYGTLGDRGARVETREGEVFDYADEGGIFRFDPDGSNFEFIHRGLRNPKEIAFDEFGNGVSVDNNSDQGDKSRVVYIVDGGDSGWRIGHQAMHSHHRQIGLEQRPPNRWMEERMWEPRNEEQPAWLLPPVDNLTSGPSGLDYHPGVGFLESEVGRFLICDYRGGPAVSGIWSFALAPSGAGMELTDFRRFNWGGAVTDVTYSWDGRVFVSDFIRGWNSHADGRVYELAAEETYRGDEAREAAELIAAGFDQRSTTELAGLLGHGDQRVRTRAQLALTRKEEAIEALAEVATGDGRLVERLHGVWGLGVIARRGAAARPMGSPDAESALVDQRRRSAAREKLLPMLADGEPEVRAQAVKMLGECGGSAERIEFPQLLVDESPRVRMFAAIAAGHTEAVGALPYVWRMIIEDDNRDAYLRHAGAYALELMSSPEQLMSLKTHDSPALRLAAVIALGRLGHERVADFLSDPDPEVAREAIRLIHDRKIESVRPHVAALLASKKRGERSTMMWWRLLHSAFRIGDATNAGRVLEVALDGGAPPRVRSEALRLLAEWNEPHPVDQSLGEVNPLPERDPEVAGKVLQPRVGELLKVEGKLLEAAIAVVEAHELDLNEVPGETIRALVLDAELPGAARGKALDLYAARESEDLAELLVKLAGGEDDALALSATRRLVKRGMPEAVEAVRRGIAAGSARRQQECWNIAAELESGAVVGLFVEGLRELTKSLGKSPAAIEMLEAARQREEAEVAAALKVYEEAVAASQDPLAAHYVALEGGDVESGARLFGSHPAAQCMRCHAGGGGGHGTPDAMAGPNLADVGKRGDRRFMLESMIVPGAEVASGFGVVSATLKDGSVVGGILVEEGDERVVIDVAGDKREIAREDIASISEPVSAMPPMGALLKPAELRDLVAWLATREGGS